MEKKYAYPIIVFVLIIAVWEGLVNFFSIKPFILPAPSAIAAQFSVSMGSIAYHFFITMSETVLGFLIAVVIGVSIAVIFDYFRSLEWSLYPYIIAIKVTPIIAVAPFLVIWFGNGIASKVVAAAMMAIFPIVVSTIKGFKEIGKEYLEMMNAFSATKWQTFLKIKFPNSIPYLFSGLKIATALSMVGAVVAEFVGSNQGLGFLILTHSYYLKTASMFASLFALCAGGIAFFGIVSFIEHRFLSKYGVGKSL